MHPNETYDIVEGRIVTRSLEVHIVDQCNLRCADCCSLSPVSDDRAVSPTQMAADLDRAGTALAPARLKLVGGEPLLHPGLDECLRVARTSGIAPSVSVTTNGLLLARTSDEFWALVDHLTISLYPAPALRPRQIAAIERRAHAHNVELNWKHQHSFVAMDRDTAEPDDAVTRAIYRECWLRRRCHLVADGRFYTCTRPSHFHTLSSDERSRFLNDGVPLDDSDDLVGRLYHYLVRPEPLRSCSICLGGDASERPHRQLSVEETRVEFTHRRRAVAHAEHTVAVTG